jgi:2-methylisocitrate lyase-like PEP mutase family enzyme
VEDDRQPPSRFLALHVPGRPLLMPNAWDAGSAKLLVSLGFHALATTSSGFAATLGRTDGSVRREEAIAHAHAIVQASPVPVSADLENGFAHDPEGVAQTAGLAVQAGLAGFSIEDYTGDPADPIYDHALATERVRAAAEVAHRTDGAALVLSARAENLLHGRDDIDDTVQRLAAYADAGADVVFAPGLKRRQDIEAVIKAVDRPLSVLALPGVPPVAELASLGVSRVSVGGAFAFAALGAMTHAGRELIERGTYGYWELAAAGREAAVAAFARSYE